MIFNVDGRLTPSAERAESSPQSRRGFLRALSALPLIGGGVALIGSPTASAAPVTVAPMRRYVEWLSRELMTATAELDQLRAPWRHFGPEAHEHWDLRDAASFAGRVTVPYLLPDSPASDAVAAAPPSTRAAVVLSAAGAPLA